MLRGTTIFIALPAISSLAQSIAQVQGADLLVAEVVRFADGEIEIHVPNKSLLQGKNVCIIQSTNPPVHDSLFQLLLLAQELNNARVHTISALIPYFGYGRHDVAQVPGGQTSVALVVKLLKTCGIKHITTIQIHNPATIASLDLPVHSISMAPFIAAHIKNTVHSLDVCLIAPDQGAQLFVAAIARILGVGYIAFTKKRYEMDKTKLISQHGSCKGTTAIIIDDMITTGSTALNVCNALAQQGYTSIYGYFIHPVLSGDALQKLEESLFTQIFVSNSIPLLKIVPKVKIFDIAKVIDEVVSPHLVVKENQWQKQ